MDLNKELNTKDSMSGGQIVIRKKPNGSILVQRNHCVTRYKNKEILSRYQNWLVFKQLHLSTKPGEVFSNSLPLSKKLKSFLYHFAMSPAGALWVQKVVNLDLYLLQKNYYSVSVKKNQLVFTPTEDFLFELAYSKFYITETQSSTYASGSFIAIASDFLSKKEFSQSKQKIDHMAVLSHEFGHTKFGEPKTRANIYSEADTVLRYENPVRILNHFLPRKTYFDNKTGRVISIYTKTLKKAK